MTNSLLAMILGAVLVAAAGANDNGDDFSVFLGAAGIFFLLMGGVCLLTSILIALFV
jgi:hypothetical protein